MIFRFGYYLGIAIFLKVDFYRPFIRTHNAWFRV